MQHSLVAELEAPPACATCARANRADIDHALVGGRSQRQVAIDFGISRSSVRRHVGNGHVVGIARKGWKPSRLGPDASPGEVLREALEALRSIDTERLSHSASIARIDAVRRTAEALSKIEPPPRDEVEVSIDRDIPRGIQRFMAVLFEELESFPEVRERLFARTAEFE